MLDFRQWNTCLGKRLSFNFQFGHISSVAEEEIFNQINLQVCDTVYWEVLWSHLWGCLLLDRAGEKGEPACLAEEKGTTCGYN